MNGLLIGVGIAGVFYVLACWFKDAADLHLKQIEIEKHLKGIRAANARIGNPNAKKRKAKTNG